MKKSDTGKPSVPYACLKFMAALKDHIMRMLARPLWHGRLIRVRIGYVRTVKVTGSILSFMQYVGASVCLASVLLYAGFSPDAMDRSLILKTVHACQIVFICNVLFNILFVKRTDGRRRKVIRGIAYMTVLSTMLPALWPSCGGAELPALHFLHSRVYLFSCLVVYSVAELSYGTMRLLGRRTNPSLILSASFIFFIAIGSFVLMLPNCTQGAPLRYIDALFMAASAVSMTGLSTIDTVSTFTPLGWGVMAVLMQIGALGVLTFTSFFALFFSGRTSIYNQIMMRDFVYSKTMTALVPMILYILTFTVAIEIIGAVAIYFTLPDGFDGNWGSRVAYSAFHSLSAFCNCGFTTMHGGLAEPALMNGSPWFYIVIIMLILAGGIGFPNLVNLRDVVVEYFHRIKGRLTHRHVVRKTHVYDLNTKLVLVFSLLFFLGGAIMFYLFEFNHAFAGLPTGQKVLQAFFCSATVRTAGFVTYGPESWLGVTFLMTLFLMWVGCSSQSMGGGIKINAFAAVVLNLRSVVLGQKGVAVAGRSISMASVRRANAVVCFSIFAIIIYAGILMVLEPELPAGSLAFEAFSAITTVGMSFGVTPELSDISKVVLASAMFLGRVGIISVLCGIVGNKPDRSAMLPSDDIIIN